MRPHDTSPEPSGSQGSGAGTFAMTLPAIIGQIVELLEWTDVPYMITGSIASSLHGEPRSTRDGWSRVQASVRGARGPAGP